MVAGLGFFGGYSLIQVQNPASFIPPAVCFQLCACFFVRSWKNGRQPEVEGRPAIHEMDFIKRAELF
jgi:hypothetical protein